MQTVSEEPKEVSNIECKITITERKVKSERKVYNPSDYCWECQSRNGTCASCSKHSQLPKVVSFTAFQEGVKKRKFRPSYICTVHCKYDIVRQIASKLGMRESVDNWNVLWSDFTVSCERVKNLKRYQKVNHFPGMIEICRKDLLARNLNRMYKLYPNDYDFFPRTWLLPTEHSEIVQFAKVHRNKTYILKPDIGCKGKGISLTKSVKHLGSMGRTICQEYISKPYLINGYKFDLRVYALLTSCDPLRLYVYNEGLARFATKHYAEPNKSNLTNMYMHLTNYSVNKFSRTYVSDPDQGSKRKFSTLNETLRKQYHDVNKMWKDIDDVIVKTVFLALPTLQHNYRAAFPNSTHGKTCFEVLGFDLLLDHNLKPYLLEVNHSPSFHTDAPIDREVKEALLIDTFKILNLPKNTKQKIIQEDRQIVTNRLLKDLTSNELSNSLMQVSPEEQIKYTDLFEVEHKGNYRKIYPTEDYEKYDTFYCQGTSSLFNDTFASRAREKAVKLTRENQEAQELSRITQIAKMRMSDLKPLEKNNSLEWIMNKIKRDTALQQKINNDESSKTIITTNFLSKTEDKKILPAPARSLPFHLLAHKKPYEEKRISQLNNRQQLLESMGALEKIHSSIKRYGELRLMNEIKRIRKNKWSHHDKNIEKRISLQHSLSDVIQHIDSLIMPSGEPNYGWKTKLIGLTNRQ